MDWQANVIDDDAGLARILREARTVAVLGAKGEAGQPAFYVPAYLKAHGYRVLPVNPTRVGERILGESVVATLADLGESPDVIEIFRRPQFLQAHAAEIIRMPRTPAVVWFQLGIRNDGAAETLARAGIRVVQDRCMMPEHRRLLGAA
jgi:predicted CoA-binding protein